MANRYWVGGTANWDATAGTKWALTSGGAGGQAVPGTSDDVFFDGNSGSGTCTLAANADIKGCSFVGFTGTFAGSSDLSIRGNFLWGSGMTQSHTGTITLVTGNTIAVTCNGKSFGGGLTSSATTTLQDAFLMSSTKKVVIGGGTFNTGNFSVSSGALTGSGTYTLTMGSSTWTLTGDNAGAGGGAYVLDLAGTPTLTANTGTFKFTNTGTGAIWFRPEGLTTYNNIWFSRGTSTGDNAFFADSGTFADIKDDGTGTHLLYFEDGQTYTCTTFSVSGTSGHLISCWNRSASSAWTLSVASGTVSRDYLNLRSSTATGGATFYAGANSTNTSGNSGWIFTAPPTPVNANFLQFM